MQQDRLSADQLESSRKGPRDLMDTELNMSQQCAFAIKEDNSVLGCLRQNISSRLRKVILPLNSTLVKPCLEYCLVEMQEHLSYDIRLNELRLFSTGGNLSVIYILESEVYRRIVLFLWYPVAGLEAPLLL